MTTRIGKWLAGVSLFAVFVLAACVSLPSVGTEEAATATPVVPHTGALVSVDEGGSTQVDRTALSEAIDQIPAGTLSDAEAKGIVYMREEEKLARDVYQTLYQEWKLSIFQNIASSEQTHMDAVKTLLDRYDLSDPITGKGVGEFTDPKLQELYNQLTEDGARSLESALRVGAAIEEIDILDLEKYLAQTEKADIRLVYENLMKGSRNHLRAFTSTLEKQTGKVYQPQYLSSDAYHEIVNAPMERGGRGGK